MRALPSAYWKRAGVHPKRGDITIESMVDTMMSHDAGHFEQIAKAVSAAG